MTEADPFNAELGRKVQDHRRKQKLTQEQLGTLLDPAVTRASIANIEGGKQGVLAKTLVQLARALKVEPSDLLPTGVPAENVTIRDQIRVELEEKLGVAPEEVQRLAEKLLGRDTRRPHERTSRKKRR